MFITYENRHNPHVTIHRDNCDQVRKHGGEHKYNQGEYKEHQTLAEAEAYAVGRGLPVRHCFYCNKDELSA